MTKLRKGILAACLTALVLIPAMIAVGQGSGYRFGINQIIFAGLNGGVCGEGSYNAGADVCLARLSAGQMGVINGGVNLNPNAVISPPPVVALATATSGGTIANGTYRAVLIYVTPSGGQTNVAAAGEATQATTGTGVSTITATAPLAAAGAAGYVLAVSPAAGATLTETLQPMTTTVCAGAFQVATGLTVCPFGVNAVITSVVTGPGIPLQNSAAFPAAVPQLIGNLLPQPANTSVTTIQQMGSFILGPGIQNSTGKTLHVVGHLVYTTAGAPVITISVLEGGITPIAVAGVATTGAATNGQVAFDYHISTSLTGATGTLESHGLLSVQNNTALGTALGVYADQNTAASSAINLTASNTLGINITATVSLSTATLRDAKVYLEN